MPRSVMAGLALAALLSTASQAQETARGITHGRRPSGRLVIRNALVIEGNGSPATGPHDIVIEGNRITEMVSLDPVALKEGRQRRTEGGAEIDAGWAKVAVGN